MSNGRTVFVYRVSCIVPLRGGFALYRARWHCVLAAGIAIICLAPGQASAATYSSRALIENARLLNGKKIAYKGEAVTAIMKRGTHAWVNVNDGDNAIGVWTRADLLSGVAFLGDYKHKGDIIEVQGVFNRACAMHGGTLDIHAHRVKIVTPGFLIKERIDVRTLYLAGALFFIVLILTVIFRKRI